MNRSDHSASKNAYLSIQGATKIFGKLLAVDQVFLDVAKGKFVCILGPSGCGKTTLLRIIAGLEEQDRGRNYLNGEDITDLPASRRNFGIVFQSYALFPNLTAGQNIAYGLKGKGKSKREISNRVKELLTLVGLETREDQYPSQLSGGQQQRVALARALAPSPSLLLLDEPLSALDARVREKLRHEVRHLQESLGITTVMVTHDQGEALTMADRIVIMDHGRIVQQGTPEEIYKQPVNPFVADFIGSMNFLRNVTPAADSLFQYGAARLTAFPSQPHSGNKVMLAIRPEDIELVGSENERTDNTLTATVGGLEFRGSFCRLQLHLPGDGKNSLAAALNADITPETLRRLSLEKEMVVRIQLPPDRILVFADAAG